MPPSVIIGQINNLHTDDLQELILESVQEGFRFVARLAEEYASGSNRFDKPGEILLAAYWDGRIIGIVGLNQDPYLDDPTIGRVRHLYVATAYRRMGVGRQLMAAVVRHGRGYYNRLTLRTDDESAAAFYCALGFKTEPKFQNTTHHLSLTAMEYVPADNTA